MTRGLRGVVAAAALGALLTSGARAATPEEIQAAVGRGVAHLKQMQHPDGSWSYGPDGRLREPSGPTTGATALAGLALLECGVAPDDPHVRKAADVVRTAVPSLISTYNLSLSILFLDRLGEPADEVLVDSLAVRLLAGQNLGTGGWSYECPPLADEEVQHLRTLVGRRNELVARADLPPKGQREVKDLPKEIQAQLQQVNQGAAVAGQGQGQAGDNSNTQFAVLALWVARRQGIPVAAALKRIDRRFRTSQGRDGGWGYTIPTSFAIPPGALNPAMMAMMPGSSTPAMTCSGLLGLAVSHGWSMEATARAAKAGGKAETPIGTDLDPAKDLAVRNGLLALGSCIGKPLDAVVPQPALLPRLVGGTNGKGYYFLWSLERVAVAYGLATITDKDWYAWGADILLDNQNGDGSWQGLYADGGCDTSFALLFLRRANLAPDLTAILKGRVTDPGARELRAGGVGGAGLAKGIGLKPAFDTGGTPAEEPAAARVPGTPDADRVGAEAGRLAADLVNAEGAKQAEALDRLRDSKGGAFTEALARAIPKLTGEARSKARDALADRLTRMTAATLGDKLRDDDPEVRRAAALASAMKEERSHVPRLIDLLADPEPPVARAAHAALKSLTAQDFGPEPDATRADVAQAVLRWKDWWRKNGEK